MFNFKMFNIIVIFGVLALLKVGVNCENECVQEFDLLTCSRLSNELDLEGDVQRLNLPSGSAGVLIDARLSERLTIDDSVDDIECHNILNINTITVMTKTKTLDCVVNKS